MGDLEKKCLTIGDYVTFNSLKHMSYLCAEGIILEDVYVDESPERFDDCLFCIHLQRQYSAAKELDHFLEKYDIDAENVDPSTAKYLKALEKGRNNENNLNNIYMEKKVGQEVRFGDIIQLYHVKSGKYLQVVPKQLAKCERENLSIVLNAAGNSLSWIQIAPRYKINREGDPILTNTEVYLKFAERSSEYIHVSERHPNPIVEREVNCSLESTHWMLGIFQSSIDAIHQNIVLSSQIVSIHDPETKCNLTIFSRTLELLPDDINPHGELSSSSIALDSVHVVELPNVFLAPVSESFVDSNALWSIESEDFIVGGPLILKGQNMIRFKHLNSGLYMKQDVKFIDSDEIFFFSTTNDASDPKTLMSISEINFTNIRMSSGKPLQIRNKQIWMRRGSASEDLNFPLIGTRDRGSAVSLLINHFIQEVYHETLSSSVGDENRLAESLDVYSGLASRRHLKRFLNLTAIPRNTSVSTIWPGADRKDLSKFESLIERTVFFIQGFPISSTNIKLGVDKSNENLRRRRQSLVREQGVLEVLICLINKLKPITSKCEAIAALTVKERNRISEEEQSMLKMGNRILEKCLFMLYYSIRDNPDNQMYVADFMTVLLSHLGKDQPRASSCVTEMLSNNMELQETKIKEKEIKIFVDKLRASKMGAMYLNLLQACCSCQGNGVDNNQCKVAEMLFRDTNDIIINVNSNYSKLARTDWNINRSLYIPSTVIDGSPVRGYSLVTKGLPQLSLAWTTKSIDFSPLGLFGKLSVSIEELFSTSSPLVIGSSNASTSSNGSNNSSHANSSSRGFVDSKNSNSKLLASKKNASAAQKDAVANYFIAELKLSGELCLDRNYIGMSFCDKLFTYESLVTMLKIDVRSDLKSAAARLMFCLIIDRDPQSCTKIPCLTRTWTDLQKSPDPVLPYVEPARRNIFALTQEILSQHIKDMAGRRWDEYSLQMLRLLKSMVTFNFYGTTEKMKDVIDPLVAVLDRRETIYEDLAAAKSFRRGRGSHAANKGPSSLSSKNLKSDKTSAVVVDEVVDLSTQDLSAEYNFSSEDIPEPWQKTTSDFLESFPVLVAVLGLTVVAVSLTVYQAITNESDDEGTWLYIVGIVILIIFFFECSVRAYCYRYLNGNIIHFLMNGFNQIDISVILLDVAFLCIPPEQGGGNSYSKTIRLVRFLRLLRVLRAARVVQRFVDKSKIASDIWIAPFRYSKAPIAELETMVEAVHILQYCQQVIEDRNISLLLRRFYEVESGDISGSTFDIFSFVVEKSNDLSLGTENFDFILLDALMFNHSSLVQGSLELLVAHHSKCKTLIDNASNVQLLTTGRRERQFKIVDQMLQQLERNAETHELWGELKTEMDKQTNKQTKDILSELTDICRLRRQELELDNDYIPDKEMQNLFRNLGCFEICMKVMGLLDSVDPDENGAYGEVSLNTRSICILCNTLLYWFILENPKNQGLAYEELGFFLNSLDKDIYSHLIVRSIFKMNEGLMKVVPRSHLTDLAEKICKVGKSHHYLALFSSITYVGEKNIPKNQFEIMKVLTAPGIWQLMVKFFVPVEDPEYLVKVELMKPYLKVKDVSIDELPPDLAYHLVLLDTLSGCTVGRTNVTTVEAKLQNFYDYSDVIDAILDPNAILIAKKSSLSISFQCCH